MDASRQISGSIHDKELIIQFKSRYPEYWVHIISGAHFLWSFMTFVSYLWSCTMVYHKGKGAADSRGNLNDSTALRSADTFSKISVSDFGENVNRRLFIPVVVVKWKKQTILTGSIQSWTTLLLRLLLWKSLAKLSEFVKNELGVRVKMIRNMRKKESTDLIYEQRAPIAQAGSNPYRYFW